MHLKFLFSFFTIFLLWGNLGAFAQSPFGVGTPEAAPIPADGLFSGFFRWVAAQQSEFYQALTGTVREMKDNGSAVWTLVGLSFLYGVFHAAGPGHGKVVMSSYVLANQETARRGAVSLSINPHPLRRLLKIPKDASSSCR